MRAVTLANCLSTIKKKVLRFTVDFAADTAPPPPPPPAPTSIDDPIEDLRLKSPFELYIFSNNLEIGCKYRCKPVIPRAFRFSLHLIVTTLAYRFSIGERVYRNRIIKIVSRLDGTVSIRTFGESYE